MPRVITGIAFDLSFDITSTPPAVYVNFTDQDAYGRETHGTTRFHDAEAASLFPTKLLDAVKSAIEKQASAIAPPSALADKLSAAADAERRARKAEADALDANVRLAEKLAAMDDLDAQIAAKAAP